MDGSEMVIHFLLFGFMAYELKMAFTLLNYRDNNAIEITCSPGILKCLPSDPPEKFALPCPRGGAMHKVGCAGRMMELSAFGVSYRCSGDTAEAGWNVGSNWEATQEVAVVLAQESKQPS